MRRSRTVAMGVRVAAFMGFLSAVVNMPADLLSAFAVQDVIILGVAMVMFGLGWMAGK